MKWWATYTILPVNASVRLLHPQSRDNQDQKTFLSFSNYMETWILTQLSQTTIPLYEY